jgi:hypothetical protein
VSAADRHSTRKPLDVDGLTRLVAWINGFRGLTKDGRDVDSAAEGRQGVPPCGTGGTPEPRCSPLCGAEKAYGRFVKPWHHDPRCPAHGDAA